ncbi:uncharacterized protein LOC117482007 [Trematomus bernacchii]|uniref:uncharacterized protein LOC117482007 n=1 Tax=Trematomus bernacchii TaxID=40690 RepID=UPI00146A149D|nr:uncharacterized protein LOC117482007 [Trematomus bernacchii]
MVPPSLLTEMRGAAMSLTAAASGLVVFLLSVSVVQGQNDWGGNYTSSEVYAVKGSTVEINCTYTYPSRIKGSQNKVNKTFWFIENSDGEPVDMTTVSEYAGRVEDRCENNICTLRIKNLTESDSAEYKFRIITTLDKYAAAPGVTLFVCLSVTGLTVQFEPTHANRAELKCQSSCLVPSGHYVWYENGEKSTTSIYSTHLFTLGSTDRYSCALKGHEDFPSHAYSTVPLGVLIDPFENHCCITCLFSVDHCFSGSWKLPAAVSISVVLLAVISLSVFLWIRRKRASRDSSEPEERADNREECVPDQPEQQDDLQYATVHFSNNRADPLYSNMRAAQPLRHTEQQEVPEYAPVKFSSAAPRPRGQDSGEDPAALYSTVNKSR